jgi:polyferredoxin
MFFWAFMALTKQNEYFTHTITALQFFPSYGEFIVTVFAGGGAGFILILIFTYFYGRAYCSFLCPLGAMQDIAIRFRTKALKKTFMFDKPLNWLKYGALAGTIALMITGSLAMLNLLDPFSNFGRIVADLFRPAYIYLNNTAAYILGTFDIFGVKPMNMQYISLGVLGLVTGFFVMIVLMSLWKGRLYCNTLCPVGGILSLFSSISFFKLGFVSESCTSCGLCEKACKSQCIDYKAQKLDFSRCVDCYNCIDACKFGAIRYMKKTAVKPAETFVRGRKNAIAAIAAGTGVALLYMTGASKLFANIDSGLSGLGPDNIITPPGSKDVKRFTSKCIGCHLCVTNCPTKVLTPALTQGGIDGLMQPRMDYDASYCNYSCNTCSHICPAGAIAAISVEEKRLTQIGRAKFIENNCVVKTKNTQCTICNEYCPTKAASMVPFGSHGLMIPKVIDDLCIGCGACEHVCPARPKKAIVVQAKTVHGKARVPDRAKQIVKEKKAFPF